MSEGLKTFNGLETHYKYIHFQVVEQRPKTFIWGVFTNLNSTKIGVVQWYPAWRQYCFIPFDNTIYSRGCLDDVSDFLQQVNKK